MKQASSEKYTEKQANYILFAMMLVVLFSSAGIALPYPVMAPLFLEQGSPFTNFANLPAKILLGIILAAYPIGLLIGSSIVGAASDQYGRKKVLLISLTINVIGYLLSALAIVYQNYPAFVLTRFLNGLCGGNISIAKAIASDLSPVLDKTKTFTRINATSYAGWLLGPLAGGLLQPLGTEIVFYVATLALTTSLLAVATLLPNAVSSRQSAHVHWSALLKQQNSFALIKSPDIRTIFFIYFLATLGLNAFYEFYPVWLVENYQYSAPDIGIMTAVLTAFMILSSLVLVGKVKRSIGLVNGSLLGLTCLATILLSHPWLNDQVLSPVYALTGAVIALFSGLLPVYISDRFNKVNQGQLMGLLTTCFSLANIFMAIIGSIIALAGATWSIVFGGVLVSCAAIWFHLYSRAPQTKTTTASR